MEPSQKTECLRGETNHNTSFCFLLLGADKVQQAE
jgi:hypothetical protein